MKTLLTALAATLLATSAYAARDDDEWTLWKSFKKWTVETNGVNACLASGTATTNTMVTFAMEDEQISIHVGNPAWERVFLHEQKYWIEVKTDGHPWNMESPALSLTDGGFSISTNIPAAVTFAEANAIEFYYGGVLLDTVSLKGSYEAAQETATCLAAIKNQRSQQPAARQLAPKKQPAPAPLTKQPSLDL